MVDKLVLVEEVVDKVVRHMVVEVVDMLGRKGLVVDMLGHMVVDMLGRMVLGVEHILGRMVVEVVDMLGRTVLVVEGRVEHHIHQVVVVHQQVVVVVVEHRLLGYHL